MIYQLDFDSLDVYFHGDDLDQLDQDSSLHKLIENVKSKVQPKMAAIMKQMLSSDKKEREEAKSIRFICSISRKFFLEMPHLVLALKDGMKQLKSKLIGNNCSPKHIICGVFLHCTTRVV